MVRKGSWVQVPVVAPFYFLKISAIILLIDYYYKKKREQLWQRRVKVSENLLGWSAKILTIGRITLLKILKIHRIN